MNDLYELIERHVAGESTPVENAQLQALLQDQDARATFVRHVTLMAAVRGTCKATDQEVAELQSMQGAVPVRRRVLWFPRMLALAASLAIVAGGVWWVSQRPDASLGLRVAEVRGKVAIEKGKVKIEDWKKGPASGSTESPSHPVTGSKATSHQPRRIGDVLRPGDGVETGADGYARLAYPDGTQVELHGGTRLQLLPAAGADKDAKRLSLSSGLLIGSVVPQKSPFLLETPHGVAEVVGTHFSLGVNAAQTTLAVREGEVALRQADRKLTVKAGETVVADAKGTSTLAPADAWIRELLVRAETGPWDVVNLGTGLYSNDVWRMDARGGPADRKIWNLPIEPDRVGIVSFRDGKRWARGVVTGRMRIEPDGQTPLKGVDATTFAKASWRVSCCRVRNADADAQKSGAAGVCLSYGPAERESDLLCGIVSHGDSNNAWYRYAVYFDTEALGGLLMVTAAWPEGTGLPSASAWQPQRDTDIGKEQVAIGLIAKGVLMEAQGLKFVPLGPDMPLPPKELLNRK